MIVEGQSEQEFVTNLLLPKFYEKGIQCEPRPVVVSTDERQGRKYSGGIVNYERVKNDILRTVKSENGSGVYYTTMFDFYGRIKDFPGYAEASRLSGYAAVACLEQALLTDIQKELPGLNAHRYFIPNFLFHEFESLLMTDVSVLGHFYFGKERELEGLTQDVAKYGNPEFVNSRPEKAPSKRILNVIPRYDKVVCGTVVASEIGVDRIAAACRHFREWLDRLYDIV